MKEEDLGVPSLADMLACPTQFRSINSVASTTSTPLKLLSGHSHSHSHSQNTTITTSINNNGNTNTTSNKNNSNNKGNGNEAIVAGGGGGRGGTGGGGGEVLQCPRCESFNTKFCYYNNYSLSQPRHYCKNCKRYWTRGGTLRTVPIGGACRKNNPSKPDKSRTPPPSHGTSTAITTHTATMPLSSTDLFTGASSSSSSGFLSLLLGGGGGSGNGMDPNETLLDQFSYGHPRSAPFPETLDMFPKEEALHSGPDTSGEECRAASASEAFTGYTESTPKPFSSTFPWKQRPPRAPMDIGSPLQSNNPPPGSFINNHTSLKRSMLMMLEDDGSMQDEEQKKKLASSPGNEAVPLLLDWQVPPPAPSSCVGFFEDSWNDLSHYGYGQGPFT